MPSKLGVSPGRQSLRPRSPTPRPSPSKSPLSRSSSLCGESPPNTFQFYEVLFVGKAIASHKRAPPSFIDEALKKLKQKAEKQQEMVRQPWDPSSVMGTNKGQNRTMLLQIGRTHLRLISPDRKQVLLHKSLKEISHCSPGQIKDEHFGFICGEASGTFLAYIFRCDSHQVVKELLKGLTASFRADQSSGVKKGSVGVPRFESKTKGEEPVEGNMSKVARRARRSLEAGFTGLMSLGKASVDNFSQEADSSGVVPSVIVREPSPCKNESSVAVPPLVDISGQLPITPNNLETTSPCKMEPLSPRQRNMFEYEVGLSPLVPRTRSSGDLEGLDSIGELEEEDAVGKRSPRLEIFDRTSRCKTETKEDVLEEKSLNNQRLHIFQQVGTVPPPVCQSGDVERDFRKLWKKVIRQQIFINRVERELKSRVELKDLLVEQQFKLGYEDLIPLSSSGQEQWERLLSAGVSCPPEDFKVAVADGVSKETRGEVWRLLVKMSESNRIDERFELDMSELANEGKSYSDLKSQLTSHQHAILIDLGRTFPDHNYFKAALGPGQLALFNVLKAYSILDPEVGYCQGLPFTAGLLLMHLEEEAAFHLLEHLLFARGLRSQFHPSMAGLQLSLYQLTRLLVDVNPLLYRHLDTLHLDPSLYATPWLLTSFASHFPLGFVSRVFDLIFLEGAGAMVKVAVCLLDQCEARLLAAATMEQLMDVLRVELPHLPPSSLELVVKQAVSWDVTSKLLTYKIEYRVLQEEEVARRQRERDFEDEQKNEVELLTNRVTELTRQVEERDQTIARLTKELEIKDRRLSNMLMQRKDKLVIDGNAMSNETRFKGC